MLFVALGFLLGISLGLFIGYQINPFGIPECLKRFGYQNITCVQDGTDNHCLFSNGTGYRIERWQYGR